MTIQGSETSADSTTAIREQLAQVQAEMHRVIVGNTEILTGVLTCMLAHGHVLLEGAPGLGKTLMVRTLAQTVNMSFSRIQFTPDLMPADITGTNILADEGGARAFRFQPGPVFSSVVLADEINRATPKTQSAMLEAMQEHTVTVAGIRHALPDPFFVLATQNPIEMEGTYPLPEAQLDRFMLKLLVRSPSSTELGEILDRTGGATFENARPVVGATDVIAMQKLVRQIHVPVEVRDHAVRIVVRLHPDCNDASAEVRKFVRYGPSPRGAQALLLAARVRALLDGRQSVGYADVDHGAGAALRHRVLLSFEGDAEGISPDALILDVLTNLRTELARATNI